MPVPKGTRSRNQDGRYREERSDALAKNLRKDYPEFNHVNGNTKLGTLKEKFDTPSLDGVLKALRNQK